MNIIAKISHELVKIAQELLASDYVHKKDYTDADEEEAYARTLSYSVDDYFDNDKLKEPYVEYNIKVSPHRYLKRDAVKDCQRKSYNVKIVMMYVDKVDGKFDDASIMEQFKNGTGSGGAFADDTNDLIIVMCGDSEDLYDASYFKGTFVHEMMHILDAVAYPYYFNTLENFGKRSKHDIKRKTCVPYPVGNDDWFDEKFAEYYTCEVEMREYRSNLRTFIDEYAELTETDRDDVIDELIGLCNNEKAFFDFYDACPDELNLGSLPTLYHLCFSKTSHGNKQTAIKILNGLR